MNADGADALTAEQIDALFAPLLDTRSLLIAVSGGPDSTALLVMAAEWAARRGARIAAATVDHGLRPASGAEAEAVATLSAKLGVPHETLVWTAAKPSTRVQERAREARYRLLIEHARSIGADAIATAHHADDQAETVLFRLMRGSGVAGLRGMEATSRRDGVTIARPLLGVAKRDLVAFCRSRGIEFADDPSNANPHFARPRLRALLDRLGGEGLTAEGLVRLARRAAEADEALERLAADVEARLGADGPIDARALFAEPVAIVQRMLARRIGKAGGRDESRIGLEKIEALALRLRDALANQRALNANVGGALVRLSAKGRLSFAPEPARRHTAVMAGLSGASTAMTNKAPPASRVQRSPTLRKPAILAWEAKPGEAIMLWGIDPLLDADLLYALRRMGHGDEIAIVDANFPAASTASSTVTGQPLLMAGVSAARAVEAVLSVMPLDGFVPDPALRMEVTGDPVAVPAVQQEVQQAIDRAVGRRQPLVGIERFAFYERAAEAFAIVVTGERRHYGCFIFKKGVLPEE